MSTIESVGLRAGVASTVITPLLGSSIQGLLHDRKAHDVHDDLFAKCLVLDNGHQRLALLLLDTIAITGEDVAKIRFLVEQHTSIPPQNVMVAATHTHSGPVMTNMVDLVRDESYCDWLATKAADTVRMAVRRLQPARIGIGMGQETTISFCRRFHMADGTVRFNPGRGNPDIREVAGVTDPDVGVLYVETEAGTPLAAVVNFSLHYIGTDDPLAFSADYFGHFQNVMRQLKGPDFTTLLMNGAQGHTNNVDVNAAKTAGGHKQARRVAEVLAGEVMRVIGRLDMTSDHALAGAQEQITFRRKEVSPQDIELAQHILNSDTVPTGPGPFNWVVGQPIPDYLRKVYAMETLEVAKLPPEMETEVQVLRIGDAAFVALPGEFFAEIGLAIKAKSPSANTFMIGLANDFVGYVSTDTALLHEGGYETWLSRWSLPGVGAERIFTDAYSKLLHQLFS